MSPPLLVSDGKRMVDSCKKLKVSKKSFRSVYYLQLAASLYYENEFDKIVYC